MADKLQEWINDAGVYELLNTYKVEQQSLYPFVNKGDDFYISLLNKLFFTLREESIDDEKTKENLLQLVKGLIVYSDDNTADRFSGVNKNNNLLYIAAIYFLCEYYALSNLFMWKASAFYYPDDVSQLLYTILSGSFKYSGKNNKVCNLLKLYMETGNESVVDAIEDWLNQKIRINDYNSLDDFFDTHVSLAVIKRFRGNNMWKELSPFGGADFWKEYIAYSVRHNIFSLLPSQIDAIQKGVLSFKRSFSLKMPTSAGKTFLTELLIYQEINNNPYSKILYLAPLRSLSRELKERYGRLSREFKFDFRAAYGGCTTSAEEETIENAKLLIATPETFTTLEGTIDQLTANYTLVICDEGQLLEDKSRGASYELLLTRLKRNQNTRFLFISAIIPNISDINEWLGGSAEEIGDSGYRPCKIRFALAYKNNDHALVKYANETMEDWSVDVDDFLNESQIKIVTTSQKSFSCALALKAMDAGPVMLYCSMKDGNRGCIAHVEEVMKMLGKNVFKKPTSFIQDQSWLEKAVEYCAYQLGENYRLTECIRKGIAYHHGQMPQDIREIIEVLISKRAVQLVVCTKTLSEGVNMPIKTAVLANITNPEEEKYNKSLGLRDLKNIVGRVGRAGKESYGLVILPYNGKNREPSDKVISVLSGQDVERANGTLYYVVKKLLENGLKTDNEINDFLEIEGVAKAIDTFINLNKDDIELDNINLDEVVEDSLAYHLGDENVKQGLRRVFNIRYSYIKQKLKKEEYGKYLKTGLPLKDYNELSSFFAEKSIDDFDLKSPIDGEWIHVMMETIYSLSSVKRDISFVGKTKPLYSIHQDLSIAERILAEWLSGSQYDEMAELIGCTTEQAALYVDFIQKTVAVKAQAIISYINESYDISSEILDAWPDMVKSGVHDVRALYLIDSGLGDRILVNILSDYASEYIPDEGDKDKIVYNLIHDKNVDDYIMALDIPVLVKERWSQYLRMRGIR